MFLVLASGMNYTEQQVHLYKVFFFFSDSRCCLGLKTVAENCIVL